MKQYKSHKIVEAARIEQVSKDELGNVSLKLDDGFTAVVGIQSQFEKAEVGGYVVRYGGGYESYSPAKAFEEGYTELPEAGSDQPKLDDNEQYRQQMAGISTAAYGYWRNGDSISPDYDTLALRDVASLYDKYERLHKAIRAAMNELGIPQPGTPAPVQEAFDHLHRAFYHKIECSLGPDDYRPAPVSADLSGLPG